MATVQTVLGPIHPELLGLTEMHEHIQWGVPGWEYSPDWWYKVPRIYEKMQAELLDYKDLGGRAFVDVSGMGLGRDLELYVNLARSTGVHIIACTGFWADQGILGYFRDKSVDYFTDLFARELTQGMGKTNIRAGIIKLGNSRFEFTDLEERTYRAGARAAKRTGAIVTTHGVGQARRQVQILLEEGLDPGRAVIGHLDANYALDIQRDKEFARQGFYIGYDHIGIESWSPMPYNMPDEDRVKLVLEMIDAGFEDLLILSCDVNCWSLGWKNPYHTPAHLLRYFVPKLLKAGVPQKTIDKMLIEHPKKLLPF